MSVVSVHLSCARAASGLGDASALSEVSGAQRVARGVEWLPFTVRVAQGEHDLRRAAELRHAAYSRHLPAAARYSRPHGLRGR